VTTFDYIDRRGVATQRQVEPVQLVHNDGRWYVAGYDIDRDDWRVFRLDRCSEVQVGAGRFTERTGPDPTDLVQRRVPTDAFRYQAHVRVECTAAQARQQLSPAIAEITDRGDHCRVVIGTDDLTWLTHYLLGLPWPSRVIKPAALRRMLHETSLANAEANT
jgi:predicted DNA-binding transcriptional regulator YafY